MAEDTRTERDLESRDSEKRDEPWVPARQLPDPNPRPGLDHRYVRASMRGVADNINVSQAMRDGWVPVKAAEYPELKVVSDRGSQFPDCVEIGGLLLMARPSEIGEKIQEHAQAEVEEQMKGLDRNYFREEDPRMPMLDSERRTKVTFGDS